MRITLIGGTGDIGRGLALRWGLHTNHEVVIGSRDAERAVEKADEYTDEIEGRGRSASVEGFENAEAAEGADVVVLAVPPYHVVSTVEAIEDSLTGEQIIVSPAVGISRDDDGFHYNPPEGGSVTELVADNVPDGIPIVGAFHNLPAARLSDLDAELGIDTVVVGDDADAKETVATVAEEIPGLRSLDAGGLANSAEVEGITPLLINLAQRNEGMHDLGVTFE